MARRDRNKAGAGHSPLVELEAELRALERKRREAIVDAQPVRRFEGPKRVAPGSWAELESAVYLEQAA